ncbi:hypothetical protein [Dactylosporangium sp. CS-033363]|uniref:hypothetical protein n=1 Tax=Dactylosporangium sp. CS-033363 TaxID=3239935 RepID=UPI003D916E0B
MERASLLTVLADIAQHGGCRLLPPVGPVPGLRVPDDLRLFYEACGGAILFEGAWTISGPEQLVPASPRLLGPELAAEVAAAQPDDLTNGCFVFAETGPGGTASLVVVDLHPARAGRYYDAFWDRYGLVGEMPVIAVGVAEVLRRLLDTRGEPAAGIGPVYGDAYDAGPPA